MSTKYTIEGNGRERPLSYHLYIESFEDDKPRAYLEILSSTPGLLDVSVNVYGAKHQKDRWQQVVTVMLALTDDVLDILRPDIKEKILALHKEAKEEWP